MKSKLVLPIFVLTLAVVPMFSRADSGQTASSTNIKDMRVRAQADLEARRKELEQKREDFQNKIQEERSSLKAEMDQKKEDIKNEVEQKKADIKNQMEERRTSAVEAVKDRLNKFIDNVVERFDAAIERLSKIADRLDSRMTKMEADGIDVSKAKDLMSVARIKIETAKTSISEISLQTQIVASSTATTTAEVKASFDGIRSSIEKAKNDVKAVRAALSDVISNLKPGLNKQATSTNATSTSEDN